MVKFYLNERGNGSYPSPDRMQDEFSLAGQEELLAKFPPDWTIQQIRQETMDAAEALAIACKKKNTPMKAFEPRTLAQGKYLGTNDLIL